MGSIRIEDLRQVRPRRGNPLVVWPLRLAVFVATLGLFWVRDLRNWLTYRLGLLTWYRQRPDDVFIVSYPKSGTTLMQMILYQLKTDGSMDIPHIGAFLPWFEDEMSRNFPQIIEAIPSPRVFKSHAVYNRLPRGAKYIYVVRRPADVAVSGYHHFSMISGAPANLEQYLDRFIAGHDWFGSWFKHVKSWWPHRHDENVLWLRYEEVIADVEGAVRRVAAFCGLPIDEAQMPRILERCGIPFMKEHNDKFDPRLRQLTDVQAFIREGRAGAGAQTLSSAQRERLERRLEELARGLGCSPDDPDADLLLGHRSAGDGPTPAIAPAPPPGPTA